MDRRVRVAEPKGAVAHLRSNTLRTRSARTPKGALLPLYRIMFEKNSCMSCGRGRTPPG